MRIEIKSRRDTSVLFAFEAENNSIKLTLEAAVKAGVSLDGANLVGARLVGARLVGARLDGASLDGARLDGARLDGASLDGARLVGARLVGASLHGASAVIDAGSPNGWRTVGWLRDGCLSIRVGCRDKRLAEGREYWAGKEDRREVLAALDYVEAVAKIKGWRIEP